MKVVIDLDTIEKQRVWLALWDDNWGLAEFLKSSTNSIPLASRKLIDGKTESELVVLLDAIHPYEAWNLVCNAVDP